MPEMTLREWITDYRVNNEWERQERLAQLPAESKAESVRTYLALSSMLVKLSGEPTERNGLWELRLKHYQSLADKWIHLSRHPLHDHQLHRAEDRY
jgi:hypothetical protein